MTHPFQGLQTEEFEALVERLFKAIVPQLPQDSSDERSYRLLEPMSLRNFEIRRSEGRDDNGVVATRFFMSEFVPNGRLCRLVNGIERFEDDERVLALENEVGPNGFCQGLTGLGLLAEQLVYVGGGYCVGAKYHASLQACARAVASALVQNVRYEYSEEPTSQQKVRMEAMQAREGWRYWQEQKNRLDEANRETGLFKGCFAMLGPLHADTKQKILSYLNEPSQEDWLSIRGFCITGSGTLWQAWCVTYDHAPQQGSVGFPTPEALRKSIRNAVATRSAEIDARLAVSSPTGLRAV